MLDVQQRPELIRDRVCDLEQLSFIGMRIGMPATALPKERIVEVSFSPLVRSINAEHGQPIEYNGHSDRRLTLDDVRASVVYGSGVLHTADDLSFTIIEGRIARVSLYGRWLDGFRGMDTLESLYRVFGTPDQCFRLDAEGDELGCDCYYAAASKWLRWTADRAGVVFVVYGSGICVRAGGQAGVSRVAVV